MIQKHFMAVLGRMAILWVLSFAVIFVLNMTRYLAPLGIFVQLLLIQPLVLVVMYEMYKSIKAKHKPSKNPQSTSWLVVSIIGWILFIVIMIAAMSYLVTVARTVKWDKVLNELQQSQKQYKNQPMKYNMEQEMRQMEYQNEFDNGGMMKQNINIQQNFDY